MAVPGDTVIQHFKVEDGGSPVTGLTTGSFTFNAYSAGSAAAWSPTVAEIGSGYYSLTYTLPSATTSFSRYVVSNTASHEIIWPDIDGEVESTDLDTLLASVVTPVATIGSDFTPQGELQITYIAGDTRPIVLTIEDNAGNAIDIQNDYTAAGFGIRSKDGTTSVTEINGASVTAVVNVVSIAVLAGDNFQSAIADGIDTETLYWDFQATKVSDSKKYTLARGKFLLKRQEYRQ